MTSIPFTALRQDPSPAEYEFGPDSLRRVSSPTGRLEEIELTDSTRYPGTVRKVWLHSPVGITDATECAVMFFNDGDWYLNANGDVRGAIVLDNLAAQGVIPPMIGVFVDPGFFDVGGERIKNRNVEYDDFSSTYGDFLLEEVLPLVQARFRVSPDPHMRGICGGSSGGNAALTVAWTHPDQIARVIAFNSSFAQMPGGNPYPRLLATEPPKDLRVFLHAAHRDLNWNEREENWFAESLETSAAFARAGYDVRLVLGEGGHSPNHGGVLLPDALRWIWRN